MRALAYHEFTGPVEVTNLPDPTPPSGGVVIEVMASGLCLSDWHGWQGHDPDIARFPHVPGHELAGRVVATGYEVRRWQGGERVTLPFVCGCGSCEICLKGDPQVCAHQFQPGFTAWGSFAEYVAVDYADTNLVALPEVYSWNAAAVLGCRTVTAYRAIIQQGRAQPDEWIAVHGCGGVGLSAVMFARAVGAKVVAVDINDETLAQARAFGAAASINARQVSEVAEAIHELTDGGADLSLDALGSAETCANSLACLKRRGRHVQVGLLTGEAANARIPWARVIAHELQLMGSHGIAAASYPEVFKLLAAANIQPEAMVTQTLGLAEGGKALTEMDRFPRSGVAVIHPHE